MGSGGGAARKKKKKHQIKESLDVLFLFLNIYIYLSWSFKGVFKGIRLVVVFLNRPGRDFGKEFDWSWSSTSSSVESHDFLS